MNGAVYPPFVIGRVKGEAYFKPRQLDMGDYIHGTYCVHSKVWMTSELFRVYVSELNKKVSVMKQLILESRETHGSYRLG